MNRDLYSPASSDETGIDSVGPLGSLCRNEQRRVCHINAEQKRRCNIKNGFDTLKSILPTINQSVSLKISKASMLQKASAYITNLDEAQKEQIREETALKQQIDELKATINMYQNQLPASGGKCTTSSHSRGMLQDYIRRRTLDNWKFWLFSLIIEPLHETYEASVVTTSVEESCKTMFTWLDRCCSLLALRKGVLNSLTFLSTSTEVLTSPHALPIEAVEAVRSTHVRQHLQQSSGLLALPNATQVTDNVPGPSNYNTTSNGSNINNDDNNNSNGLPVNFQPSNGTSTSGTSTQLYDFLGSRDKS